MVPAPFRWNKQVFLIKASEPWKESYYIFVFEKLSSLTSVSDTLFAVNSASFQKVEESSIS